MNADDYQVDGSHYKTMDIEPWKVMESVLTKSEFIGFLKGNIIKYSMRAGKKTGANEDSAKAKHYMQKLDEFMHHAPLIDDDRELLWSQDS